MDKIASLSESSRRDLFLETADRKVIPPVIVEKDFWVCWVLRKLFIDDTISPLILFKGGTTLSKVFNLIERFSEDIDLIIDWRLVTEENPNEIRSRTKQEIFNQKINEEATVYISETLCPSIQKILSPIASIIVDNEDPHVINIFYPSIFDDKYISPKIRLETGPLASWLPNDEYSIRPYAAEAFPKLFDIPECQVKAIKAERTFWEKVTILHQEAHRPKDRPQLVRYSRHYYDLYKMANSKYERSALNDIDLLKNVVAFKQKFYPRTWARYDLAQPKTIKLVPPSHLLEGLKEDYSMMRNMIFGEYPSFDSILNGIKKLEMKINQLSI